MKIINKLDDITVLDQPTSIALGTFDGMHIGHQEVIRAMVDYSKKNNLISVVYTFSNHPKSYPNESNSPKRLMTPDQKSDMLNELGVDLLIQVPFDNQQVEITAAYFLNEILLKKLNVKHISVGYDFRFGKSAEGNVDFLRANEHKGYSLEMIEPIMYKSLVVSSTHIRNFLMQGQVLCANKLLGRPYCVEGYVNHGKKMGRQLGFPTANLKTAYEMSVLKSGVYISQVTHGLKTYNSVTNVGFNPTFDQEHFTIETYIIDFDEDIYGEAIQVKFLKYLRPEIKFSNLHELIHKINEDVQEAKEFFEIMT